jgi:hypothetical protein
MVRLEDYNPHERILAKMTVAGGFDEKDRREFKKTKNDASQRKVNKKSPKKESAKKSNKKLKSKKSR